MDQSTVQTLPTSGNKVVLKAWGHETFIVNNDMYCGKVLSLKEGKACSLHYHKQKHETFYVIKGTVLLELNSKLYMMNAGGTIVVPQGTIHRFSGITDAEIVEVSTHDEPTDSYRLQSSGPMPVHLQKYRRYLKGIESPSRPQTRKGVIEIPSRPSPQAVGHA